MASMSLYQGQLWLWAMIAESKRGWYMISKWVVSLGFKKRQNTIFSNTIIIIPAHKTSICFKPVEVHDYSS